jgi:hypothetical protein
MFNKKTILVLGLLGVAAIALAGCIEGPEGPAGPPGPPLSAAENSCTDCHDDTTRIFVVHQQWEESLHGSGDAYERGTSTRCTGCHASEGFSERIETGVSATELENAPLVASKVNCRTCHEIHTTYTEADFELATTDVVTIFTAGETYDGGDGNLCANCHQPLSAIGDADADGNIEVTSTHWGPHHGTQSTMLLGLGGGGVTGTAAAHASMVEDTCVTCHMGEGNDHSMEPDIAACTNCHSDAEDFDINGTQTEIEALLEEVEKRLEALGIYHDEEPVKGTYPVAQAQAMWNYLFILEDGSHGVHNSKFAKAMLDAALDALPEVVETEGP